MKYFVIDLTEGRAVEVKTIQEAQKELEKMLTDDCMGVIKDLNAEQILVIKGTPLKISGYNIAISE